MSCIFCIFCIFCTLHNKCINRQSILVNSFIFQQGRDIKFQQGCYSVTCWHAGLGPIKKKRENKRSNSCFLNLTLLFAFVEYWKASIYERLHGHKWPELFIVREFPRSFVLRQCPSILLYGMAYDGILLCGMLPYGILWFGRLYPCPYVQMLLSLTIVCRNFKSHYLQKMFRQMFKLMFKPTYF